MSLTGLYAIVDADALEGRGLRLEAAAEAMLAGGAGVLQLRAKERSAADTLSWLRALHPLTRRAGVPLFANDRADLAELARVEGVHLGQEDLPLREVRGAYPGLLLGISTHGLLQLEEALALGPDYLALGPIFETRSKARPDPVVGLELLAEGARRAQRAGLPLVAIGGITLQSAPLVAATGALPAVIAALLPEAGFRGDPYLEISERTRRLAETLTPAA